MDDYIERGSNVYGKAITALFLGSFVTFASLYSTQPLIPLLAKQFHVSPASASLSLSLTTGTLALCMLIISMVSESKGRKPIMTISLMLAAVLSILAAFSPSFSLLLVIRALQGIVLAGFPAIAMVYVNEEFHPKYMGRVMGIYVGGSALGGLSGRLVVGWLTEKFSWHVALGVMGVIGFLISLWFWHNLPDSHHFSPKRTTWRRLWSSLLRNLKDPALICLYGIGFLLMGGFVTLYNYIGYPLMAPPYDLSQSSVGLIFIVYLVGTFSSAWMGRLADRFRRSTVLWYGIGIMLLGAVVTINQHLVVKIIGVALFTFGFFGSHSVVSSWVGKQAHRYKTQAMSLYLLFYYLGSSVIGTSGGLFWSRFGWDGVISMIGTMLLLALLLTFVLAHGKRGPSVSAKH
ncbi:MFS transporter [Polycladomyces subterraneus]|uniref:MFS transporter n=1 Tax=Polycladomyces subterraneus TaxID=1016997 RepID=A0ABT8IK62_9BACL|nr:MFS transporter [Polycladomyces subterraneus]MDN4593181.1 MFS transporter [Polycladomyces subterraneus]